MPFIFLRFSARGITFIMPHYLADRRTTSNTFLQRRMHYGFAFMESTRRLITQGDHHERARAQQHAHAFRSADCLRLSR